MKILHIAPNAYPFTGGIEVLLRYLSKFEKERGVNEFVIAFPDRAHLFSGEYLVDQTRVIPMKVLKQKAHNPLFAAPTYSPMEIVQIFANYRDLLIEEQPDVVHLHDYSEASLPVISIALSLGIPLIQQCHTLITSAFPIDLVENFKKLQNFIVVSQAVKSSLDLAIGRESGAVVIPNGIPSISSAILAKPKSEEKLILMVGRCVPSKGFRLGFDVLQHLLDAGIPAYLEIIGVGPTLSHLKIEAEDRSLSSYVTFAGLQSRDVVLERMRVATVLLVPSEGEEGFGLVVIEAGAVKTPVVATRIGGLSETVIDGSTGFLLPAGDVLGLSEAVKRILTEGNLAEKLGEAGFQVVQEKYGILDFAMAIDSLYQLLLTKGSFT